MRLGIFYINNKSLRLDFILIFLTVIAILNRDSALKKIHNLLMRLNADEVLLKIAKRKTDLVPAPPPGSDKIVESR